MLVLESIDGGKSFVESSDPSCGAAFVEQTLAANTVIALLKPRQERPFSQAIDRAMRRAYDLDREALLQKHPALRLKRSACWTPLFVLLGLASVIVPVCASRPSSGLWLSVECATSVALLLLAYVALTFTMGIRDCFIDMGDPSFPFFGAALHCATQPPALAALFLPITLLLSSSRLAVTRHRWLVASCREAVARAWTAVAITFWLGVLLWPIWCTRHLLL
jgi:hypothetical protein